jgi:hypothetical protein
MNAEDPIVIVVLRAGTDAGYSMSAPVVVAPGRSAHSTRSRVTRSAGRDQPAWTARFVAIAGIVWVSSEWAPGVGSVHLL